ncbi:MAG: leucine-rich repeat domain-containing protein [Oscillospiraceae bacterium]|nr:leucine-rich repeat domain-containing protein [Oscillospiraceae bacterium]
MNKKTCTKFIVWVVTFALALAIIPAVPLTASADFSGSGWDFDIDTLTVTTNEGTTAWRSGRGEDFEPADVINVVIGGGVTAIGESAFNGCTNLTSVTFSGDSKLETIGNQAFQSTGLISIVIPGSVKSIADNAFFGCTELLTVTFGNGSGLGGIGEGAFHDTPTITWNNAFGTLLTPKDGETVTIEAGASGTLNIPANSTVTIDGYREAEYASDGVTRTGAFVDNGDNEITLNIPATSQVIWRVDYKGSVINVTGGGSLEITSGFLNDEPIPEISVKAEISVSGGSAALIDGRAATVTGNLSPDDTAVIVELTGTYSNSTIGPGFRISYGRNDGINVTPADAIAVWTRSGDKHGIGYVRDKTTGFIPVTWASVEDASPDNTITVNPITNEFAVAATYTAVAPAPPHSTAVMNFTNASTISQTALVSMMTIAQNADVDLEVHADSLDENGSVLARITLQPSAMAQIPENINLSASAANKRPLFEKNFGDAAASVNLEQQGTFGGELRLAVKVALPKNPSKLKFYAYDPTKNRYEVRTPPNFLIDDRGYPYMFSKGLAGDILISPDDMPGNDAPLPRTRSVVNDDWYVHFYVDSGGEYVITDEEIEETAETLSEPHALPATSPSNIATVRLGDKITLLSSTPDAEILYSTSGTPNLTYPTDGITVTGTQGGTFTVNAKAVMADGSMLDSEVVTFTYKIADETSDPDPEEPNPDPDNGGGGGSNSNPINSGRRPSSTTDTTTTTSEENESITGTEEIIIDVPVTVIQEIAGNLPTTQIAATSAGSQLITTTTENAGQNAVLLVFNEETGEFEVVSAATVNADGTATVNIPGAGDYIVVVAQTGDLTGTGNVTAADALLLLQALTGTAELNPLQKFLTSSRSDSKFTATDALNILKFVAGMIDEL